MSKKSKVASKELERFVAVPKGVVVKKPVKPKNKSLS